VGAEPATGGDGPLVEATRRGDEAAFVAIYRRYGERVYRFAYRMTGSAELARDVTQDCFASLLEPGQRYDARRASLGTYLCGAARNQCLKHARRAWRERADGTAFDARPALRSGPLELLLEDERARAVREAVGALPPLLREVLILADYEELELSAIAEIVGARVGAVKVRLHRARRKLRVAIEARWGAGALVGG